LGLPSGYGKYDIPLVLSAKQYNTDGTLYSPASETTSLYGDVIHVNGQPWPYLKVEPRKYRFRFLNAAISRSFKLYFEKDTAVGKNIPFNVIASDAGLLSKPISTNDLYISMAERWEVVMDFSSYAGQNLTLRNTRGFAADDDYLHTDKVMKFVVGKTVSDPSNNNLPSSLRTVPFPKDKTGVDHHFKFERTNGEWMINGITFANPNNRVLAKPKRGTVEIWELENSSGGWTHPIHIHLIDMKILKRTGGDRSTVMPYEAAGLKDVVWLGKGETVTVEAHYAPWDGVYMFHCHNLIHEDHEMMAAFNVTVLEDLGYNETHYIDPMEERWRAKPEVSDDFQPQAIDDHVQWMASFSPYDKIDEVEKVLEDYYNNPKTSAAPSTLLTSTRTSSTVQASSTTSLKTKTKRNAVPIIA
jgi:bilirubin oxidase